MARDHVVSWLSVTNTCMKLTVDGAGDVALALDDGGTAGSVQRFDGGVRHCGREGCAGWWCG